MNLDPNLNGRKWARSWLIIALIVSVIANITHTVLADSQISLWLRVPGAMVWPIFTFAGIEILVRIVWERRASHLFARVILLAASIPAAITSYEHLYKLLGMMGEAQLIQIIGPAAIDGLMIGSTMTLLFTRAAAAEVPAPVIVPVDVELEIEEIPASIIEPAPVVEAAPPAPRIARTPRGEVPAKLTDAVTALLDGMSAKDAAEKFDVPRSTIGRYNTVKNILKADAETHIDAVEAKVHPMLLATMTDRIKRERHL